MAQSPRSIAARLIYPALFFGLFAVLPVALAREDKCTNTETAYMIAKRFTAEREGLSKQDDPDFPWLNPAMVAYRGSCTHDILSFFERRAGTAPGRTDYTARVHYDVLMNRWSLEDWQVRGDS
jgi:hypothetical protein